MAAAKDTPKDTPKDDAPAAAALTEGEHNPFLEGLLNKGKDADDAIKEWMKQRTNLRDSARQAVAVGFASEDQAARVEALWPTPKRNPKDATVTDGGALVDENKPADDAK